ncbi:MAG: mannose-1-phosphate guanylyltransferase [Bacteroidales bacterium]|nr:mannose-1-phosphate guanylyltransferase [Bacteroidales bacterium]
MSTTHVVIMAGGIGSRLFPLSTPEKPKQFLDLLSCGKSLIRLTYERFLAVDPKAVFWVVTSANYIPYVREMLPEIPSEQVLAEPMARNTAPCISYACRKIGLRYPNARIVVTPSDAYVPDYKAFAETVRLALSFVEERERIVCLGIHPTFPSSDYGYIKELPGDLASSGKRFEEGGEVIRKVDSFKEKPSTDVAQEYLDEGGYWWNAGIFIWSAKTIETQLRRYVPGIEQQMDTLQPALYSPEEQRVLEMVFPQCEKISIDYALMEKSPDIFLAPCRWEWSDLGSFEALEIVRAQRQKSPLK